MWKPCLQNLICPTPLFTTECTGGICQCTPFTVFVHGRYTNGAFLREAFFRSLRLSWSCQKRVLSEAFVRPRAVTFHIAWPHGGRVIRVQRAMRGIFDVKVLFPRLVCSASKFQTSCLWNLTRASLAKATTRASYPCLRSKRMHLSVNLMNEKSL